MNVAIVYIYPAFGGAFDDFASRFASTYKQCVETQPHQLWIVSNGGKPTDQMASVFEGINCSWIEHDNSGYDIGAFQSCAERIPCDLMVFLGSSTYPRRQSYLDRVVKSYEKNGESLYGTMCNFGCLPTVHPHLRSTGFWCSPGMMNRYPVRITDASQRYGFEHGDNCFTQWAIKIGLNSYLVDWESEYTISRWGEGKNSFHSGDQSGLIFGDKLTDPPFFKLFIPGTPAIT